MQFDAKDKVGRDKRMIIEELKTYCTIWHKSSEMARHVGVTQQYVSRSIIPEMLMNDLLVREYLEVPRHPA